MLLLLSPCRTRDLHRYRKSLLLLSCRGVHILKRPAQPGERPWECFKGTITVNVPAHYVLAYAFSLDERGEWDDIYNTGRVKFKFNACGMIKW